MSVILVGKTIQLVPLGVSHFDSLYVAAQHESIWTYTLSNAYGDQFHQWFEKALRKAESGEQQPFVVQDKASGKLIGSTRYYNIDEVNQSRRIGYTWYHPDYWGRGINTEAKYLLLQHAFEALDVNRIEFSADARNARSCAALAKIGAVKEGVLRQDVKQGSAGLRDSCIYSILGSEWPQVKTALKSQQIGV